MSTGAVQCWPAPLAGCLLPNPPRVLLSAIDAWCRSSNAQSSDRGAVFEALSVTLKEHNAAGGAVRIESIPVMLQRHSMLLRPGPAPPFDALFL